MIGMCSRLRYKVDSGRYVQSGNVLVISIHPGPYFHMQWISTYQTETSLHPMYNMIDNFRCADQLVPATVTYKYKYKSEQQRCNLGPMLY